MFKQIMIVGLYAGFASACVHLAGHQNFDVEQYLGKWNLIAFVGYNHSSGEGKCVSESYAKHTSNNTYLLETAWSGIIDGEVMADSGIATLSDTVKSHWEFFMDGAQFKTTITARNKL